jgi:glycosyltransferase involved in cell wall biosynthesis
MKVSVIVPTYNGAHKLPGILNALRNQSCTPDEILVVVDGSKDNTETVLQEFQGKISFLKIIYQENRGRAKVRNNGAKEAIGDLLIFFDDDMRPLSDVVEKHILFHQKYHHSILAGRATLDPAQCKNDFSKYRVEIEKKWIKEFRSKCTKVSFENYAFTSQNLSCTKNSFLLLGGFDERLNDSEDFDFSIRALEQNISVYYDYNILAWHDDYIHIDKYIQRQIEYVKARHQLGILKPHIKALHPSSFMTVEAVTNKQLKQRMFLMFEFGRFWRIILNSSAFKKCIPQAIRYKLYDFIITGSVISNLNENIYAHTTFNEDTATKPV